MERQHNGLVTLAVESTFNNCCVCVFDQERAVHYERNTTFIPSSARILQDSATWRHELEAFHAGTLPTLLREALDVGLRPGLLSVSVVKGKHNANVEVAKSLVADLAYRMSVPVVEVDHHEAHLLAGLLCEPPPRFPFLGLTVAGGHCHLQLAADVGSYRLLGTHDVAARNRHGHGRAPGAVLDRCSELLGLVPAGEPDGAIAIDKLAGRRSDGEFVHFPRTKALNAGNGYDIDLHELYDEVLERRNTMAGQEQLELLAVSAQECVMTILLDKAFAAAAAYGAPRISFGGGVASNHRLRERAVVRAKAEGVSVHFPAQSLCVDNARMIAFGGLVTRMPELASSGIERED
ncbi:hypothetical protein [Streptomyces sp. L2]|uniref:Kae1-like domain-containing protein n=1 Tax=Streptomyces sp. L2 TaxID=2162665 RepID=UPI001013BAE1|nr:hypothetical protein [Streptomyces sp. L2]